MKSTESHPLGTRRQPWIAGLTMAGLAAVCAVISYNDGLLLIHLAGAHGRVAYLYPLLPDGLVIISTAAMYEAARAGIPRPGWAVAGIALGAGLTIAMNAAAGAVQSLLFALADLFVPIVFFVALEVLIWLIRRGRGGAEIEQAAAAPATSGQPPPATPLTTAQALAALVESDSQRKLAAALGVSKSRVEAWSATVKQAAGRGAGDAAPAAGARDRGAGAATPGPAAPVTLSPAGGGNPPAAPAGANGQVRA